MDFYKSITQVYESIFPKNQGKVKFLKEHIIKDGKTLDIACGVGTDLRMLEQEGFKMHGIDLDHDMVEKAKELSQNTEQYKEGSMAELTNYYNKDSFDNVLCTGNSLVHLPSKELIKDTLQQFYMLLKDGGTCIIQIINFNRILDENITALPTIVNDEDGVTFHRKYTLMGDKVLFTGHVETEQGEDENAVELIALRKEELMGMMKEVGFSHIEAFSSFKGDSYKESGYATILVADK